MATLYDIDKRITDCIRLEVTGETIDPETGEIIDEVTEYIDEEALEALLMERENKIEGVALWYKNLLADEKALKAEKQAFENRRKTAERKIESLKGYLSAALAGEKFETTKVKISFRKSEQVVCDDIDKVPDEYLRFKGPELNKATVKNAIKWGEEVPGCRIKEKYNIQIK